MSDSKHVTYEDAGVDTAEGGRAVDAIKQMVKDTNRPEVIGGIGGFGGLFSAAALKDMEDPILISGTDGVGTKLVLAQIMDRHETVGQDLVAMCVNDILASGAEPLFFLDYVAIGHIEAEHMAKIIKGVADGCKLAGCALVGGEMAEHPGVMAPADYDLAGFTVGVVDRPKMLDPANVRPGDVILGLPSTGVHSNGYSLVRKVIGVDGIKPGTPEAAAKAEELSRPLEELGGASLADALLAPTRIYVKPILELLRVVAWNHRPHPYAQAEADGIFCKSTLSELMDAEPDVVGLCNPLKAMPAILAALAPLMGDHPNTTLTDVGSVKGMVRDQVKAAGLGKCYVGAHPMAGNELSGWQAADPHLYDGALWAITVDESTDYRRFLDVAAMITKDVGNRVIVVDDETHDKAAAMISHMPHVVSTALINELVANPDRNIAAALAAGCWRDMTRVSLTDPDRTRAMVEEDSLNVEALLRRMAARLTDMADQLHAGAAGEQDVMGFFAEGDPFRRYKAAVTHAGITAAQDGTATAAPQAGTTAAGFPERELAVPEAGWQQTLLFSARRGEAITGFIHPRQAIIQLRPAM